jgi:sensor histidine kinase regulating citrate/malate metabolism
MERTGILNRELQKNELITSQINPILDGVIRYMMMKASAEGIQFEIAEMNGFASLIESVIQPIKLQTLIADLVENAINATKNSNAKRVLISLCEDDGIFCMSVYDSGTCFDAETLLNLGKKKKTTRNHEGGSGTGYMEIFKILNESNASLTITEFEPEQSCYTKSISIRFDDKAEHILQTYRSDFIMNLYSGEVTMPLLKIMCNKAG